MLRCFLRLIVIFYKGLKMNQDKIKEKINSYRLYLTIDASFLGACAAWFITNYNKGLLLIVYYDMFAISIFCAIFIFLLIELHRLNEKMED